MCLRWIFEELRNGRVGNVCFLLSEHFCFKCSFAQRLPHISQMGVAYQMNLLSEGQTFVSLQ